MSDVYICVQCEQISMNVIKQQIGIHDGYNVANAVIKIVVLARSVIMSKTAPSREH